MRTFLDSIPFFLLCLLLLVLHVSASPFPSTKSNHGLLYKLPSL